MKRKSFSLLFLDIMNWTCLIYPLFFPSVAASASLMSEPLLFFCENNWWTFFNAFRDILYLKYLLFYHKNRRF